MKRKHVFKYATMLICALMGLAMAVSCSKDDNGGGGSSGSGNSDNYSQYVGKWSGSATSSTGGTWGLIIQLYANKIIARAYPSKGGTALPTCLRIRTFEP